MPTVAVADAPERSRYELTVDGDVVGYVAYGLARTRIVLSHTEVEEGHEGEGLGGRLARDVLTDLRARGLEVVPTCPFIAAYIDRHPEFIDVVTPALQGRFR